MILSEQNLLFFTRTMGLGGTENVVLQLCEIFQPFVKKIIVCSNGGVNTEKLQKMGIAHYTIPDIENKSPANIWSVIRILMNVIKTEKITVIHTHHRMAAFFVSLLRLYKKSIFINTSHNTFSNRIMLTRIAYKHAHLIACGEMVKRNLTDVFGLPQEQITVIHNAVKPFDGPVIKDTLIERLHSEGCFVVGNIGRLSEQKGMEYYIEAIPSIVVRHPKARFLIIGSGEDEQKLRTLAEQLKITDFLYFAGYRTDIQNLMAQLELVVLSSLWEGLPLTPIEAFSVGTAVVATAVDGTMEIVKDGENGLLVNTRSPEQIADRVNWIIEHPEEREKMNELAKKSYDNNFSFHQLVDRYAQYYLSLP